MRRGIVPEEMLVQAVAEARVAAAAIQMAHRRMIAALGLLALLVAVCCTATAVAVLAFARQHSTLVSLASVAKQNQETGDRIRSCTDPAGECFKRGQQRTGKAVAGINQVTIAVGQCVKDPPVHDVRACLIKVMAEANP